MKILAVILNFRTPELTMSALRALVPQLAAHPGSSVVVVDNDSGDGSVERIRAALRAQPWRELVDVVSSGQNGGYAYGNNVAIRPALAAPVPPDLVYLLNPDAAPEPGAVDALVRHLDDDRRVGIVGSHLHGPDGEPHNACFRFPTLASELETSMRLGLVTTLLKRFVVAPCVPARTIEVDWVAGASMMIRRRVLEEVGLLDEGFFLYYEETDLCRRARAAGWRVAFVRASSVTHVGSVSTGLKDATRRTPLYLLASRRRYFLKHHGAAYLATANVAWALGFSTWRARRAVQRKPDPDRPAALSDFVAYNFNPARPSGSGAPRRSG